MTNNSAIRNTVIVLIVAISCFSAILINLSDETDAVTFSYEGMEFEVNSDGQSVTFNEYQGHPSAVSIPSTVTYDKTYTVTAIKYSAFNNDSILEYVWIPDTVERIGSNAFSNCDNLTTVRLPANLRYIESSAFYSCDKLASIDLPDSLVLSAPAENRV